MTLRELPHDPTIEVEMGIKGNLAWSEYHGFGEGWCFYRETLPEVHYESILTLEAEGDIPQWQRDVVNFPLRGHPFLSGQEKFDAILEVQKCILSVENFLFTSLEISPRG
jgi:hypothetical protein